MVTTISDMAHVFRSGILVDMPIMAIETGIVMEVVFNVVETGLTDAMAIMEITGNVIVQHRDATEAEDVGEELVALTTLLASK
jgi:hypothetical protein